MLILDIQFWPGDKMQAMALARLLADLEPRYRDDATVLFTARFDATHDQETIDYVAKKFPVRTYTTQVKSVGWPSGCNQMMAESYQHCVELTRSGKVKAEAVMLIEADAVPLRVDWLDRIVAEYRSCGKMVLGAWLKKGDAPIEHVNGNCILSLDLWRRHRIILTPPAHGGWDCTCSSVLLPNAAPSRLIWSDYHLGGQENPWRGDDYLWESKEYKCKDNPLYGEKLHPVWFHGPKDMRGIEAVKAKLLGSKELS